MKKFIKSWLNTFKNIFYRTKNVFFPPQKIIMLHTGRCGSTVLSTLFQSDNRFQWEGEAIQFYYKKNQKKGGSFLYENNPLEFLMNLASRSRKSFHGVEVKALRNQDFSLEKMPKSWEEFTEWALKNNYKIILLYRDDVLKQVVSGLLAFKYDLWHTTNKIKNEIAHRNVNINVNQIYPSIDFSLLDILEARSAFNDYCKKQNNGSILVLNYERDILEEPNQAYIKTIYFLGLNPLTVSTSHKIVNPKPVKELIENYNLVKEYLKNTNFYHLLDNEK